MQGKKRVAVVGSGCSGLAAIWALKSTEHEVHLYEAGERLGGHTNTVGFEYRGQKTNVDTGFIVLNAATYRKSMLLTPRYQYKDANGGQQTSLPS